MQEYKPLSELFPSDAPEDMEARKALAKTRLEADSTFRTGIVTPVGELFVAMPRVLVLKMQSVIRTEKVIEDAWRSLSPEVRDGGWVSFMASTIMATNLLDGVECSTEEADGAAVSAFYDSDALGGGFAKRPRSRVRFAAMADLYAGLLDSRNVDFPKKLKEIRDLHQTLLEGERLQSQGRQGKLFRAEEDQIALPDGTFVPSAAPDEKRISNMLNELMPLIRGNGLPDFVDAAVAYFAVRYINPFYEGTGRLARYLMVQLLSHCLSVPTTFCVTSFLAIEQEQFDEPFARCLDQCNCGELTQFVEALLDVLIGTQNEVLAQLIDRMHESHRVDDLHARLSKQYELSDNASRLLYGLMQDELYSTEPATSLDEAVDFTDSTETEIRKAAEELRGHGLVRFVTAKPLTMVAAGEAYGLHADEQE